jgi:hypothetical protein
MLAESPIGKIGTTDEKPLKEALDSSSRNSGTVPRNEDGNAKPWLLRPIVWLLAGTGCLVLLCTGMSAVGIVFFARHIDQSATRTAQPLIRVDKADLSQLLADWEKNPIAVIEQHKGADVEVTGFVNEISSNMHHQTYLILSPKEKHAWPDPCMQVYLLDADLVSQMKDHPKGSKITIRASLDQPGDKTLRCTGVKIMPPLQAEVNVLPRPAPARPKQVAQLKDMTLAEFMVQKPEHGARVKVYCKIIKTTDKIHIVSVSGGQGFDSEYATLSKGTPLDEELYSILKDAKVHTLTLEVEPVANEASWRTIAIIRVVKVHPD